MKDLKLTLKELQEMYKNADATTKQYLENKFSNVQLKEDITTIIGGYTDACKYLNRQELDLENFKFLPKSQWANAFYHHKISTVVEALVGDFVPDYSDCLQYKYEVFAYHDDKNGLRLAGNVCSSFCSGGSDLLFPNAELRDHAMKIMETEYLQILTVK